MQASNLEYQTNKPIFSLAEVIVLYYIKEIVVS